MTREAQHLVGPVLPVLSSCPGVHRRVLGEVMSEVKTFAEAADIVLTSLLNLIDDESFKMDAGLPEQIDQEHAEDFWMGVGSGFYLARMLIRFMGNKTHFTFEDMNLVIEMLNSESVFNHGS